MYRPTVRYADVFKDYVNALFQATTLDRNQIIRAALFTAAHTKEFQLLLSNYKRKDITLPSPDWDLNEHSFWLEQNPVELKSKVRDKDLGKVQFASSASKVKDCSQELSTNKSLMSTKENARNGQPIPSKQEPIIIRNQGQIRFSL